MYGKGSNNGVEGEIGAEDGVYGTRAARPGTALSQGRQAARVAARLRRGSSGPAWGERQSAGGRRARGSTSGTALQVTGKAKFSRSGIVTIAAGTASKTVSLAGVTAASMVVATAQQNGTVFVKAAVPAGRLVHDLPERQRSRPGLKVAYFVLN